MMRIRLGYMFRYEATIFADQCRKYLCSRRFSILSLIIRMRRVLRSHRNLQLRILILPIDELQELGNDIVCVEPHAILVSKRPPIASSNPPQYQSLIEWYEKTSHLTYKHPQLSQKLKDMSRSPQIYCLVTAFGFVSIFASTRS